MFDLIIRGGDVVDGTGATRRSADVGITGDRITAIADLADIKLSANWMAAAGHPGEDAALFDAVRAVGLDLCPAHFCLWRRSSVRYCEVALPEVD